MRQAPHRSVAYAPPNRVAEYRELRVRLQLLRTGEETVLAALDHLWILMDDADRAQVEADVVKETA